MAGIASYFHGERGTVCDRWWGLLGELLAFHISLAGDPHRALARDYDADIGIDPALEAGDAAVYLRLDATAGIWVRESDQHGRALDDAIGRVRENRQWMKRWKAHAGNDDELHGIAYGLMVATGQPLRAGRDAVQGGAPATAATFFLSYSGGDSLLARQVYDELSEDARVRVWFDLAQPRSTVPAQDTGVAAWLERSVSACECFVLLLTRSALDSDWVQREIAFALRQGAERAGFRFLVLKAQDVAVPPEILRAGTVIDLDGLWWSRGIAEELFAAAWDRPGRRAWLAKEPARGDAQDQTLAYDQLGTEAGTVVSFRWTVSAARRAGFRGHDLRWNLLYAPRAGGRVRVRGGGEHRPADLDMKPGDRIAYLGLHKRCGVSVAKPLPLWMRSADLALRSDQVLDRYFAALGVDTGFQPARCRLRQQRVDTWGQSIHGISCQGADGLWRDYGDLVWALMRTGRDSRALLAQLTAGKIEWAKR